MLNSFDFEESDNDVAVLEDEKLFTSTTEASNSDSDEECTCKLDLYVITKEESLILDLIDRLEDPSEKREILEKYLDLAREREKPKLNKKRLVSFKTIVDRIAGKTAWKEPTISEIQHEINATKDEIKGLKYKVQVLELYHFSDEDEVWSFKIVKLKLKATFNIRWINL